MADVDYYQALGVDKKASKDAINKAFRKLAKKCHPDLNPDDKAAEKRFKEISVAHEVLSDDKKRRQYDQLREASARGFATGDFTDFSQFFRSAGQPGGRRSPGGSAGGMGDFASIFSGLFGGRAGAPRAQPQRGEDAHQRITIPFQTAIHGGKVTVRIRRHETCPTCRGSGARPGSKPAPCRSCGGTGTVQTAQGAFAFSRPCPDCMGRGKRVTSPCTSCAGQGRVLRSRNLSVKIPQGVQNGAKIRLTGEGEPGLGGGRPGDRYLEIRVKPHPHFERDGHDIYSDLKLNIAQATLGTKVPVKTLDGTVELRIPPGTASGARLRLRGKGIPTPGGAHGDHYVRIRILTPKNLSDQQTDQLRRFATDAGLPL